MNLANVLTNKDLKVTYDGKWPSACMGRLIISRGHEVIYDKKYCCSSTGTAGVDSNYDSYCTCGSLIWDDADEFPDYIQEAVHDVLSDIDVCCGGCI